MKPITGLALLAALCALCACDTVSTEGYRQQVDQSIGLTSDQVAAQYGQPARIAPLSDGRELWIYDQHGQESGGGTVSFRDSDTTDEWTTKSDGKSHSDSSSTTTYLPLTDYSYATDCETRFVFGLDRHVQKVTFEGNGCLALKPKKHEAAQ